MTDISAELEHLARKIPDPKWSGFCRRAAAAYRERVQNIEDLEDERLTLMRDFISAVTVVTDAYNAKATEATGLATDKANLAAQVADLSTKVATPEVLAAQDKVVALSEQINPSAPPADPAQASA